MRHRDLTDQIINAYYVVRRRLPHALQEAVYQRALAMELRKRAFTVAEEVPYRVYYDGVAIGYYRADLLVNDCVIIEVKQTRKLAVAHVEQLQRYLAIAGLQVGLVLNFGPEAEVRRVENAAAFSRDNEQPRETKHEEWNNRLPDGTTNEGGDNNEVGR